MVEGHYPILLRAIALGRAAVASFRPSIDIPEMIVLIWVVWLRGHGVRFLCPEPVACPF